MPIEYPKYLRLSEWVIKFIDLRFTITTLRVNQCKTNISFYYGVAFPILFHFIGYFYLNYIYFEITSKSSNLIGSQNRTILKMYEICEMELKLQKT